MGRLSEAQAGAGWGGGRAGGALDPGVWVCVADGPSASCRQWSGRVPQAVQSCPELAGLKAAPLSVC